MASLLIDLGWPYLSKLLPVFTTGSCSVISESTQPIFAKFSELVALCAWMTAVKWGCDCSRNVNQFFFIRSTQLFRRWPVCNKLCAFIHDALDHRVVRGSILWPDPTQPISWLTQSTTSEKIGPNPILTVISKHYHFITPSDPFPVPVRSAIKSNLTDWCNHILCNRTSLH